MAIHHINLHTTKIKSTHPGTIRTNSTLNQASRTAPIAEVTVADISTALTDDHQDLLRVHHSAYKAVAVAVLRPRSSLIFPGLQHLVREEVAQRQRRHAHYQLPRNQPSRPWLTLMTILSVPQKIFVWRTKARRQKRKCSHQRSQLQHHPHSQNLALASR